jgi:Tfp pilus assembly protein PilN
MAAKKEPRINLLPKEEFEVSVVGRIIKWALSTFRIIVIVTEMVVMAAFLSRFWLDARNSDLNETLKERQAVLAASSDFEKDFRKVQKRLAIASSLFSISKPSKILIVISSYLPADVFISSFAVVEDSIQIKGYSSTEINIAQFIANLESNKNFKQVTLTQIDSSKESTSLIFTLKIELAKGGFK